MSRLPRLARVMKLFRTMFLVDQTTPLLLLMREEIAGPSDLETRVKGWAKIALRSAGLYQRG